jgi:predicted MFS family arabinose efflux permease
MLEDMRAGIRFVLSNQIFAVLISMTYCSQFFGWSFQSLFPVFAKDTFGGGEVELGLMHSALGAGSLVGAMTASNVAAVERRGWLIIGGFLVQAALLIPFSIAPAFGVAVVILLVLGVSQSVFNVTAQTTLQYLVPNEYRGRVMGIWGMTYTAVGPLGQLQMGSLAGVFSAPAAVVIGSIAMIAFTAVVLLPNARLRNLSLRVDGEEARQPDEAAALARH